MNQSPTTLSKPSHHQLAATDISSHSIPIPHRDMHVKQRRCLGSTEKRSELHHNPHELTNSAYCLRKFLRILHHLQQELPLRGRNNSSRHLPISDTRKIPGRTRQPNNIPPERLKFGQPVLLDTNHRNLPFLPKNGAPQTQTLNSYGLFQPMKGTL